MNNVNLCDCDVCASVVCVYMVMLLCKLYVYTHTVKVAATESCCRRTVMLTLTEEEL